MLQKCFYITRNNFTEHICSAKSEVPVHGFPTISVHASQSVLQGHALATQNTQDFDLVIEA